MRRRRREHSLLLKASKMLVSWAQASTSHSATGGERYGHFRGEGRRDPPPRPRETLMLRAPVARSVSAYHLRSNRESAPMNGHHSFNLVEWGPGIYGAEAAARQYFHKPAAALTIGDGQRGSRS